MAAVQQPASSMNGEIKFTIGDESSDDAIETASLYDEVIMYIFVFSCEHLQCVRCVMAMFLSNVYPDEIFTPFDV